MPSIEISLDALPGDQPVRVESNAMGIVIVCTSQGIVAYEDVCPHAQWRLSEGEVINGRLECPGHGWEFDVATGRCATVPAYCLRAMRVEVIDQRMVRVEWDEQPVAVEGSNASTNR
jgi:nitrite reductase/ring-hydroxylating ferredoxin subunit